MGHTETNRLNLPLVYSLLILGIEHFWVRIGFLNQSRPFKVKLIKAWT